MTFNILTLTLRNFIAAFSSGSSRVTGAANTLLASLVVIDLVLLGLWWALDGGDRLSHVFKKLLQIGFWTWMVQAFPSIAKSFVDSLIQVGQLAGGGAGGVSLLLDPSQLASYGLDATEPIVKKIADLGITDIGPLIIYEVSYLAILACFFIMAIHVFLGVLEYYLIAAVVGIFMPFGLLQSTKFLAEKAIGAVVAAGIKLMTLSFIVATIQPVLANGMKFSSPDIPMNELFAMFLTVCALMFLTWKAPSLAASLMSGTPNLGASDITSPLLAAAGAAVGTAAAIKTAGGSYLATKAASGTAGAAASAAGRAGARTASSALGSGAAAAPGAPSGGSGSPGSGSPPATSPASPAADAGGTAVMPAAANRTLVMSSQQSPIATARLPQYAAAGSSQSADSPRGAGLGPATAATATAPTTTSTQSSASQPSPPIVPARSPA